MEEKLLKDILTRIAKGELDEELRIAEENQKDESLYGLEIQINRRLKNKVSSILKKRGISFEAFIAVCFEEFLKHTYPEA